MPNLAETIVTAVNRLKGDELQGALREIRCMLLIETVGREAMLDLVGCTRKALNDTPRSSHRIHELTDTFTFSI
jgi:hypothetical protein